MSLNIPRSKLKETHGGTGTTTTTFIMGTV